ncbi:hypothetical protein ACQKWADRAFT_102844 [Trichoderma austrokoningii]
MLFCFLFFSFSYTQLQFLAQYRRHSLVLPQFLAISLWGRLSSNSWRIIWLDSFFFFIMGVFLLNDMISFVCLRNGLDRASMRSHANLTGRHQVFTTLGYGHINTSGSGFDELIPFSFDWVWNSAASVFSVFSLQYFLFVLSWFFCDTRCLG